MKAAYFDHHGGPEVIKYGDLPDPVAGRGEVVVDIHAASVNGADWKVRAGDYGTLRLPYVLGRDFSGVVSAVGEGRDRLQASAMRCSASARPARRAPTPRRSRSRRRSSRKKPDSLSHVDAAALALIGLTALIAIEDTLKLKPGETILIQGGAGGVAGFAIQLAKHIGARVITTTSAANVDYVQELGADQVIDYNKEDFTKVVTGCDAVFETVGGDVAHRSFAVLKPGGRAAFIASGGKAPDSPRADVQSLRPAVARDRAALERIVALVRARPARPRSRSISLAAGRRGAPRQRGAPLPRQAGAGDAVAVVRRAGSVTDGRRIGVSCHEPIGKFPSLRRLPGPGAGARGVRHGRRGGNRGRGRPGRCGPRLRHLNALAGAEGGGAAAAHRDGARGPGMPAPLRPSARTARARTWWQVPQQRARPRPTCSWPWAAARSSMPPRLCNCAYGWGSTAPRPWSPTAAASIATRTSSCPCRQTRSAWWRSPPRCRPPSSRRTPASPNRLPTPSSPSATVCLPRAPWCSIPPPHSIRRTGCSTARASALSTHAVETYCNPRAHPGDGGASLQGLRLLARALPAIKRAPRELAPRLEAQFGMWQAIAAAASGIPTGASHGIGYALGASFGVAHGHTSCVMLPAVLGGMRP